MERFCRCSFIQQYKDNIASPSVGSGMIDGTSIPYSQVMDRLSPDDWVRLAFRWSNTPQGVTYWQDIDYRWRVFVEGGCKDYSLIDKWYVKTEENTDCLTRWLDKENVTTAASFNVTLPRRKAIVLNFSL